MIRFLLFVQLLTFTHADFVKSIERMAVAHSFQGYICRPSNYTHCIVLNWPDHIPKELRVQSCIGVYDHGEPFWQSEHSALIAIGLIEYTGNRHLMGPCLPIPEGLQ